MEETKNIINKKYTFEVRDLRNGEWFWIHKWVIKEYGRKIKPIGIAVYNVLSGFSNSRTQKAWPTLLAIGDLLGVSRDTVKRAIKRMIEVKIIRKERAGQYHYIYYLLKNPSWGGRDALPKNERGQTRNERGQTRSPEGANQVTNNKKEQKLNNNKDKKDKKPKKPNPIAVRNAIEESKEHFKKNGTFDKEKK